jgi:hypothetical protein
MDHYQSEVTSINDFMHALIDEEEQQRGEMVETATVEKEGKNINTSEEKRKEIDKDEREDDVQEEVELRGKKTS